MALLKVPRSMIRARLLFCWMAFGWLCAPLRVSAQDAAQPIATADASVSGVVTDIDGVFATGAKITLTVDGTNGTRQAVADVSGSFRFSAVPAGSFKLTVVADGMATTTVNGTLLGGESYEAPPILLRVATANTDVNVSASRSEVAETEIKQEERQRLFGFAPNFYVSYNFNAEPLTPKQKFKLAGRTLYDPVSIGIVAAIAGLEQANNSFSGYGPGPQGYFKRFGAGYADFTVGTVLSGAVLPVVFRQDPRYFYKGTGTKTHRALYALATAVVARGDNRKWQPAYANILGSFASGAISNLYYPSADRNGATLTVTNGLLGLAFDGVGNVFQELVFRHLSSGVPKSQESATLRP